MLFSLLEMELLGTQVGRLLGMIFYAFLWASPNYNGLVAASRRDHVVVLLGLWILPECVALVGSDRIAIGFKLTKARCYALFSFKSSTGSAARNGIIPGGARQGVDLPARVNAFWSLAHLPMLIASEQKYFEHVGLEREGLSMCWWAEQHGRPLLVSNGD
jgi:hypothetical protein